MANETTNLKLTKPEYTDTADIADINDNMDTLDGAVNGLQRDFAILANGNTHAAIAEGQYVYIRNHASLAEGLYTANAAIAANSSLTSSKVTAVSSEGVLNVMKPKVDRVSDFTGNTQVTNLSSPDLLTGIYYATAASSPVPAEDTTFTVINTKYGSYTQQIAMQRAGVIPIAWIRAFKNTDDEPSDIWCRLSQHQNFPQTIRTGSGYSAKIKLSLPASYRGIIVVYHLSAAQRTNGIFMVSCVGGSNTSTFVTPIYAGDLITCEAVPGERAVIVTSGSSNTSSVSAIDIAYAVTGYEYISNDQ